MAIDGLTVVVVGAGIAGASAAWHLARAGARVTVLEQFELGHVRGSSHGQARIFRLAYDEPDYVRLGLRALDGWRAIEEAVGGPMLRRTGALDLGPTSNLAPIARAFDAASVPYEALSRREVLRRFGAFSLPPDWAALYQPDGGVVDADAARLGLVRAAIRAGAEVAERERALAIEDTAAGVAVRTERRTLVGDAVVVAAAGWSRALLEPLGIDIPLTVTREHVAYFAPPPAGIVPFICHANQAQPEFYGLPNGDLLKVGEHLAGPVVDPDSPVEVEEERLEPVRAFVRAFLPTAGPQIRAETCLYASSPDDDFVLDRVGNVVLGIGLGGHGFKFGSVVGELLAGLVVASAPDVPARFARRPFPAAPLAHGR